MRTGTHKIHILKRMYHENREFTFKDFAYYSNPNQYFCELENQGLIKSRIGIKRVKYRFIPNECREKVKRYLQGADKPPSK